MDANNATPIIVNKTTEGFVPAFDKIQVEMTLAILYFDKAAAKVKPPNNNKITEFHIVDKMNLDEDTASINEPSSFFNTCNTTIKIGIKSDVTNNGIVSVAQSKDAHINNAKQFFC